MMTSICLIAEMKGGLYEKGIVCLFRTASGIVEYVCSWYFGAHRELIHVR